jgi:hypothetical protein
MNNISAAEIAKRRLTIASRRLGTKNPVSAIGGLIDRSFDLPLGDPRYGNNLLTPGHLPLEHSFSEMSPSALRLDMEPLGPGADPHARAQEASREMRRLVNDCYGQAALRWFDGRSEPWRGNTLHGNARFGAWFGMAVDPSGLQEAKVYYEMRPHDLDALPPNLQHAARVAQAALPNLVPIFTSIACGRKMGAQRLYFFHRGDLRLLDLEPLLNALGVGHQLPGLLAAVGVVLGGRFILPEGSVILGLRDTSKGMELKLDVLIGGMPDPPPQMYQLINMVLAERPNSQNEMRRWAQAMTPDDEDGPGRISVVSFRVQPQLGARCSIYLRPSGYTQMGRGDSSPSEGMPSHLPPRPRPTPAHDPYRV